MNDALHDPPRWKDGVEHGDVAERAVGHAIRCARAVPPRRAPSLSRVAAGIRSAQSPRRLTWVVVTAAFILGIATAASAARLDLVPSWLSNLVKAKPQAPARDKRPSPAKVRTTQPTTVSPSTSPLTATEPPVQPAVVPAATAVPAAAAPSPVVASEPRLPPPARKVAVVERTQREGTPASPLSTGRPVPAAAPVPPSVSNPMLGPGGAALSTASASGPSPRAAHEPLLAPTPTYVPTESPARPAAVAPVPLPAPQAKKTAGQYLSETVRLLRAEHSPAEALRFLDGHSGELERGGLAHEVLILRVEALLALDRRPEVLRLLDGASLTDVAASRALLVTRGQLRAAANRCGDGVGDFDLVLARSPQPDRQALLGRALCRKRLGDGQGSAADVQRLQREFPGQPLPAELTP
jgi:hypothetical protein